MEAMLIERHNSHTQNDIMKRGFSEEDCSDFYLHAKCPQDGGPGQAAGTMNHFGEAVVEDAALPTLERCDPTDSQCCNKLSNASGR